MKLKTGLYRQYDAIQKEKADQSKLHEKHNIDDATVKIVEKSNMFKYLVHLQVIFITWLARIAIFALAGIGAISLIYPSCRADLILILQDILAQIKLAFN